MYRIYGNGEHGYKSIGNVADEETMFNKLDPIVENKTYDKYLIIENKDNTDIPYGMFFNKTDYEELKVEKVKRLKK